MSADVDYEEERMLFYYEFDNNKHDGDSFEDLHGRNRRDVGFDEEDASFVPVAAPISLFENKWDGVACDDDSLYPVSMGNAGMTLKVLPEKPFIPVENEAECDPEDIDCDSESNDITDEGFGLDSRGGRRL